MFTRLNPPRISTILSIAAFLAFATAAGVSAEERLKNFDQIWEIVQKYDVRRIEDLLPLLPENFRSTYLPIIKSQSVPLDGSSQATAIGQAGDQENPRIILIGDSKAGYDGSLLVTFNGSQDQPGFFRLEGIEFDKVAKRSTLKKIDFFPTNPDGSIPKPVLSGNNPQECLDCHRKDPRPNWDDYFFWPTILSGQDENHPIGREVKIAHTFNKARDRNSRYKFLPPFAFHSIDDQSHGGVVRIDGAIYTEASFLTRELANQNGQRMGRIIREDPTLNPYRYAFLGAAAVCENIEKFIPEKSAGSRHNNYDKILKDTTSRIDGSIIKRYRLAKSVVGEFPPASRVKERLLEINKPKTERELGPAIEGATALRFVAEVAGREIDDWSMSFASGSYNFNEGTGLQQVYRGMLEGALDPEDRKGLIAGTYLLGQYDLNGRPGIGKKNRLCAVLKKKSLKALTMLETAKTDFSGKTNPCPPGAEIEKQKATLASQVDHIANEVIGPIAPPFQSCVHCHLGPERTGPEIRFDSSAILQRYAEEFLERTSKNPTGNAMPIGASPDERQQIHQGLLKYYGIKEP
ncbi:MAG: hypothetical protein ACXWP5_05220 [Bdellovibrionota bacterium]